MKFTITTKGHYDFIDITEKVKGLISHSKIKDGVVLIFVKGSTAAITLMENEAGIFTDFKEVLEKIAPEKDDYKHHLKWGDYNAAAHIKSALIKPQINVPLENGELCLGTWQQIILIDFDEKPRQRDVIVKIAKA
jgi:secondary thiamine-phosphate synthase enzyme